MKMRHAPRTLQRYLLRELATIFGMSLLALTLLFMMVLGIKAVQGGYSLRIILPWIFESIGFSFFFTVPLSLLVASTLGYGRFVADREFTAATASGISPLHLMLPALVLSGGLCLVAFSVQGTYLPRSHYKQRNITRYLVKQLEHLGDSRKGKLQIDKQDGMVYWEEIRDGRHLRGVHIEKRLRLGALSFANATDGATVDGEEDEGDSTPIPPTFINAASGELDVDPKGDVINVVLYGVDVKAPNPNMGYLFPGSGVSKYYESFSLSEIIVQFPINEKDRREGDLTNAELHVKIREYQDELARLETTLEEPLSAEVREGAEGRAQYLRFRIMKADRQLWFRRALALSVLTFGFLGFPISIGFRHNHRMVPFFIGVMLIVGVFYPMLLLGQSLVENQGLPSPICMLSGNLILLAFATFLTGKLVLR